MSKNLLTPTELAKAQNQKFPPTAQQAEVIGAKPGPLLVVAGAGAGKTETMANRVVWLVANGFVEPERVLGLTFTRKAAQQLKQRIRHRLGAFAMSNTARDADPTGKLLELLENINPTVSTYDAYAGRLVSEYGLLLPVEPSARLISNTELYMIAREVVYNYAGQLSVTTQPHAVVKSLLDLSAEIDNHMVDLDEVIAESRAFQLLFEEVTDDNGEPVELSANDKKLQQEQQKRIDFMPLVRVFRERLTELNVVTFGQQMTFAAQLVERHPEVGRRERTKFGVVMLDEYQDTSHAQRVLLRGLFGGHDPNLTVTAVGDPMQSIYGWRGATAANLDRFRKDFPVVDESGNVVSEAPKLQLTTSFRNPAKVLQGANAVADHAFKGVDRTVAPLEALPAKQAGAVKIGWFGTAEEEVNWVADNLAEAFRKSRTTKEEFTAAVLVRKKAHIAEVASALEERGVPFEIVGLAGLLSMPEIADLIAIATMLVNPQDNAAALRILSGPAVSLGANDIMALHGRAQNLAGRSATKPGDAPADPKEKLLWIIENSMSPDPSVSVGLSDAIADLGEPDNYSAEGYRRLKELAAALRYLRTHSVGRGLSDTFADIESIFGIRTEVLARQDPTADGSHGTVHLDTFATHVAAFEATPGATLPAFLEFLEIAQAEEDGLEPGEVTVRSDRVQLLTVHKSKGLEWKHVAVIHADNKTYDDEATKSLKNPTWVGTFTKIPSALRGDAKEAGDQSGAPVLKLDSNDGTLKGLRAKIEEHIQEFRGTLIAEAERLFYVAITRSEHSLYVSGSYNGKTKHYANAPYLHLHSLRTAMPEAVDYWEEQLVEGSNIQEPARQSFPAQMPQWRLDNLRTAAQAVADAMATPQPPQWSQAEKTAQWEADVTALLEEHSAQQATALEVPLLRELTATDLVALTSNPEHFARRSVRPVPFRPNSYAKRGTQFHEWLERRFGGASLLEEDQLPGFGEEVLSDAKVEELKRAFLESEWADRTPRYVEQPFEVTLGAHVFRGRMDAVFHEGEDEESGWFIVDWKTGQQPRGAALESASLQLAVYRHAWAGLLSSRLGRPVAPDDIRAAFYYVGAGYTLEPGKLPDASEIVRMLELDH